MLPLLTYAASDAHSGPFLSNHPPFVPHCLSDNLVEIYSSWYASTPLVLRGAGAGTGTTAAGVLSDMLELAVIRG